MCVKWEYPLSHISQVTTQHTNNEYKAQQLYNKKATCALPAYISKLCVVKYMPRWRHVLCPPHFPPLSLTSSHASAFSYATSPSQGLRPRGPNPTPPTTRRRFHFHRQVEPFNWKGTSPTATGHSPALNRVWKRGAEWSCRFRAMP